MANNPYVNKVVYGNTTLIDLSGDTVTPETLAAGVTAHAADGSAIVGTHQGGSSLLGAFPVGTIYKSIDPTSPAVLFGGAWISFGAGRVLVGVDEEDEDFADAELTGGANTHALTVEEMPSHTHTQSAHNHSLSNDSGHIEGASNSTNRPLTSGVYYYTNYVAPAIQNTGGGEAHNNMQPYITAYFWVRVADPEEVT